MLSRALATALLAFATAAPAEAAESALLGQYVDLQPVGAPIVVRGQLLNYVFVYVRLNLTSRADVTKLREKEPYFRDALVRMAYQTSFTRPDDYNMIDDARLAAGMMQAATAIAGPGQIRSVAVTSQAPQRHIATPRR